jgi:alkylhydroperoxidase family enzyme
LIAIGPAAGARVALLRRDRARERLVREGIAMARIPGVERKAVEPATERAFQGQEKKWGAVLAPYPLYARRPTILKAVQGMWVGLAQSGLLDHRLVSLVNRRVASLNGCVF